MKTILAMTAVALGLSGCAAQLGPLLASVGQDPQKAVELETDVLDTAVTPIPIYCAGAPKLVRDQLRERINTLPRLAGAAELGVWCAGDPPLTLGE